METTKNTRKTYIPAILISSALVAMVTSNAMAFSGEQDPEREANRAAVKEAISSGDYTTFSRLTAEKDHFSVINESNFSQLQEAHAYHEAGDHESARSIMDSLGIQPPHHKGNRGPNSEARSEQRDERRELVRSAVSAGDFNAFAEAAPKFAGNVTEANFGQLQQAHALREAGDHEGARAIMDSLGIQPPHRGQGGCNHGQQGGGQVPQQ